MHLLESYDNFAIFVAQEFWKFDAIPSRFTMPRFPRFSTIFQNSKLVRISWCAHVIPDIERRNVFANCSKLRIWKTDTETKLLAGSFCKAMPVILKMIGMIDRFEHN